MVFKFLCGLYVSVEFKLMFLNIVLEFQCGASVFSGVEAHVLQYAELMFHGC